MSRKILLPRPEVEKNCLTSSPVNDERRLVLGCPGLQRTKRMGFDSWFRAIRPYLWPCLYTKDMTRRVLSSVGYAKSPSFFRALSHCSTSNGSMPSAILLPHRGSRRFRRTRSYPFMVGCALGRIDSEHSSNSCSA